MTDRHDLQVRTVFSVSDPGQVRGRKPARPTPSSATNGRSFVSVLGALSLLVGAVWLYATWYPIDRYLGREMMLRGMAEMMTFDFAIFPQAPADLADPASPAVDDEEAPGDEDAEPVADDEYEDDDLEEDPSALTGGQIIERLTGAMYLWLTVTTIVVAWLGLCGGVSFGGLLTGHALGRFFRVLAWLVGFALVVMAIWFWCYDWFTERYEWLAWGDGSRPPDAAEQALVGLAALWCLVTGLMISRGRAARMAVVLLIILAGLAAYTWYEYERNWPMVAPRIAVLLLFGFAVMLGAAIRWRPFGLHKLGLALIFMASLTTVGAIAYANQYEGFSDFEVTAASYAKAFGIQSAYGWLLLVVLIGRARRAA